METVLRLQIDALCIAVLLVIAPAVERRAAGTRSGRAPDARAFMGLIASTVAILAFDAAGWAIDGMPGRAGRAAVYAADCAYYLAHPLPTLLYIVYADFQVRGDPARSERIVRPLAAVFAALGLLAISAPLNGLLFSVDGANRYVRGPAFGIYAIALFGLTAFSILPAVVHRKNLRPGVFWTLLAYPVPVIVAAVLQNLRYGLVLIWPATTVFLVAAGSNIQRRRATTDHLTGAANRRSLDEELERLVAAGRPARRFGGMLLDLDDFKSINDRLGHEAGDRALEDAAAILAQAVRREDIVARFGGDEFVLLLPGADEATLAEVAARVRRKAEAHNASSSRPYALAFSVGAGIYDPAADGSAQAFLARLDAAMYADKAARRRS